MLSGIIGNDGYECVPVCPKACSYDQILCPGGLDGNGCPGYGDMCIPKDSECPKV